MIEWTLRTNGYQTGRFAMRPKHYIYVVVTLVAGRGWEWTVTTNDYKKLAASSVYWSQRESAESDVMTWAVNYKERVVS